MRSAARLLPLAAALAIAVPAHAQDAELCRSWGRSERSSFCEVRESTLAATGTLTVDAGQNGGVTIRAYQGREVRIQAEVRSRAGSEQAARQMARAVRVNASGSRIRATGPSSPGEGNWWAVSYVVLVPARTSLTLQTINGPINVDGITGTMRLRATNGPINLTNVAGDVNGRTTNGPVNVTLAGPSWSGAGLDVETTNGPVMVRIPRGYGAHVRASTTHGPVRVPPSIRPPRRDDDRPWRRQAPIDARLNGGGPTIRAVTTNGPVTITEI